MNNKKLISLTLLLFTISIVVFSSLPVLGKQTKEIKKEGAELELENNCAPRTIGYWKQACKGHFNHETEESLMNYLELIKEETDVFDDVKTFEDVCNTLDLKGSSTMLQRAKQQLLALWMNVVSEKIHLSTIIDISPLSNYQTVQAAINKIEEFVYSKPRSIQEISNFLEKNWRTADRYIEEIEKNFGTISTRVFKGGNMKNG